MFNKKIIHNKRKVLCPECGGSSICHHTTAKCQKCNYKPKLCPHNKQKSKCVNCGGSQICIHAKQKSNCKKCKTN